MSELRKYLHELDSRLAGIANHLWEISHPIHERQNRPGNQTQNGHIHVRKVEENIWRLLNCPSTNGKPNNLSVFGHHPFPLFVLSASVCCHDFDKATNDKGFKHGEGSAYFIKQVSAHLNLDRVARSAIQKVISLHDIKDQAIFKQSLNNLSVREVGPGCVYDLRLIAVLLKAGDTLHHDASRILDIQLVDPATLDNQERLKFLSRQAINGWKVNGTRIEIRAEPETQGQTEAVETSFHYMRAVEWPCIENDLMNRNFPYELILEGLASRNLSSGNSNMESNELSHDMSASIKVRKGPPYHSTKSSNGHKEIRRPANTPMPVVKCQAAETQEPMLGIGAIPSRSRTPTHWGHMWLFWSDKITPREYRGYYPLIDLMPESWPLERWKEYLFHESVPGAVFRDLDASLCEKEQTGVCLNKPWAISPTLLYKISLRLFLPTGANFIQEGRYSFCTSNPGWNNCASWAIRIANAIMDNDAFLPLPQATLMKMVIAVLWDTNSSPPMTNGDSL